MKLLKRIIGIVSLALIVAYFICVYIAIHNLHRVAQVNLQSSLDAAAVLLATGLGAVAQRDEQAQLGATLQSAADQAEFSRAVFAPVGTGLMQIRKSDPISDPAPRWFAKLFVFSESRATAEVASGWRKHGGVTLVSDSAYHQRKLWRAAKEICVYFSYLLAGALLVVNAVLFWSLRGLRELDKQAESVLSASKAAAELPSAQGLKRISELISHSSTTLSELFDSQLRLIDDLHRRSYRDELTGLSNRQDFDARLNSVVSGEQGERGGVLMIFALRNLAEINRLAGRVEGNGLLRATGEIMSRGLARYEQAFAARRQGGEFAVFVPDVDAGEAERLAQRLFKRVCAQRRAGGGGGGHGLVVWMGFTHHSVIENGPELLSEADVALGSCEGPRNQWRDFAKIEALAPAVLSEAAIDWSALVGGAVRDKRIDLRVQPVADAHSGEVQAHEAFVTFPDPGGEHHYSARAVLPILQREGLSVELDQQVLEQLRQTWSRERGALSVNLCPDSVLSDVFRQWLGNFLAEDPDFARLLTLEVPETLMSYAELEVRQMQTVLHDAGSRLGVDGFGLDNLGLGYVATLPLAYAKVHSSFVRNIHGDQQNQFYLRTLVQLAHTQGLALIAEGVERVEELPVVRELGIDGVQGFQIGSPQALTAESDPAA